MERGQLRKKISELRNSKSKDERNTYNLLIDMLKNLDGLSSSLEDKELAQSLKISKPQVARLRQGVNGLLEAEVLFYKTWWRTSGQFNPTIFLQVRDAFKKCGEELPPLNFEQLLALSLADIATSPKWLVEFNVRYPCVKAFNYTRDDGTVTEGTIQVASRQEWNGRPSFWKGFEDMAPNNIIVLVHDENQNGLFMEAIASKTNNEFVDELASNFLKAAKAECMPAQAKKTLLEPTGRLITEIKNVLNDQSNRQKGFTLAISHALKSGRYVVDSSKLPKDDEVLRILKARDWLRDANEQAGDVTFLDFVKACYDQNFREEEKREYQVEGLSNQSKIDSYGYLSSQHFELELPIPYIISSDPLFPFHKDEKVRMSIQGNSLVITKDKEFEKKPEKT